jgi:hypothetical protein
MALLTERTIRPERARRWWVAYAIAIASAVAGVLMIVRRNDLFPGSATAHVRWPQVACVVAAVASSASAWMLFFWLPRRTALLLCALTGVLYGAVALRAYGIAAGRDYGALTAAARFWPLQRMWVVWLFAITWFPFVLTRLPARWFRERRAG